jgi:hypothetical protein
MSISLINKERFNPSTISNLAVWLDAADSNTVIETGGLVTRWNDKSPNSNNFFPTTAPFPRSSFTTPGTFSYTTSNFVSDIFISVEGAGGGRVSSFVPSVGGPGGLVSCYFSNVPGGTSIGVNVGAGGTSFGSEFGNGGEPSSVTFTLNSITYTIGAGGGGGGSGEFTAGGNGGFVPGIAGGGSGGTYNFNGGNPIYTPGGGGDGGSSLPYSIGLSRQRGRGSGAGQNGKVLITTARTGNIGFYTTPGTYSYTVPYATSISITVAGGGGGTVPSRVSGGSGGLATCYLATVPAGTIITLNVGAKGTPFGSEFGNGGEPSSVTFTLNSIAYTIGAGGGGGGPGEFTAGGNGGFVPGIAGGGPGGTYNFNGGSPIYTPGGGGDGGSSSPQPQGFTAIMGGGSPADTNGYIIINFDTPSRLTAILDDNGRRTIYFEEASRAQSSSPVSMNSSKTMIAVYRCPTTPTSAMNIAAGTSTSGGSFGIYQANNTGLVSSPYQYLQGDLKFSPTSGETTIQYAFASFDASANIVSGLVGTDTTLLQTLAFQNLIPNTRLTIGYTTAEYPSFSFYFYELILTSNSMSSSDRQEVESYLAAKWGFTLASSHPYRNFQPSGDQWIPPNLPTTISGLALWLDTAESATITSNIAGGVTGWADRSVNGCNATAGGSFYPSFSPGGGILFNGTNNFFTTNLRVNSTTHTLIAVHSPASVSRNTSLFRFQGGEYIVFPYRQTDNTPPRGYINSGGSTILFNNSPLVDNSVPGAVNLIIADISPTAQQVYLNGTLQSSALSAIRSFTSDTLTIGSLNLNGASEFYGGTLYELIVYNQYLEESERQLLEGYLAWKWNIVNKLPSSHRFAIQSPIDSTVSETGALNIPAQIPGLITWLDAADRTSVIDNGGVVTEWTDKSASLDKFTPILSDKSPIYTKTPTAAGGVYPGVFFSGDKTLTGIVKSAIGVTGIGTCFMVATVGTGAQVFTGGYAEGTPTAGNTFGFVSVDSSVIAPFQGTDPQYANVLKKNGTAALTGPTVFFARINATANAGDGSYNFDTPANVGTAPTLWQPYTPSSTPWVLGYTGSYPNQQNFYLHEFLCFSTYFNTTQRQLVEGYLAWKWGVQSRLPPGHPYLRARPQSA